MTSVRQVAEKWKKENKSRTSKGEKEKNSTRHLMISKHYKKIGKSIQHAHTHIRGSLNKFPDFFRTIGRLRNCVDAHLGQIVCDTDRDVDWWKCHWADLKSVASSQGILSRTPLKPQHSNSKPNPLANRFMQDAPIAVWNIPYVSVTFFPSLKQNLIAYRSSKVSSRPDCIFEIPQLWQPGFSRVYSNSSGAVDLKLKS